MAEPSRIYPFRPWVRRAGLSIVLVAVAATATIGWIGERALWAYIALLWIGGLKVWLGTFRPVAEADEAMLLLRPLHNLRPRAIDWPCLRGTEQMTGGDRLIVYYDTPRGLRFVALNLNLIKGRREFLTMLDARLRAMGFVEKTVERSRYLTRADAATPER
jgi:hypothetical protein